MGNKIDLLTGGQTDADDALDLELQARSVLAPGKEFVAVSAARGWGLQRLKEAITATVGDELKGIKVRIPYTNATLVNVFRQYGHVAKQEYDGEGTVIQGRIPSRLEPRFRAYRIR